MGNSFAPKGFYAANHPIFLRFAGISQLNYLSRLSELACLHTTLKNVFSDSIAKRLNFTVA